MSCHARMMFPHVMLMQVYANQGHAWTMNMGAVLLNMGMPTVIGLLPSFEMKSSYELLCNCTVPVLQLTFLILLFVGLGDPILDIAAAAAAELVRIHMGFIAVAVRV